MRQIARKLPGYALLILALAIAACPLLAVQGDIKTTSEEIVSGPIVLAPFNGSIGGADTVVAKVNQVGLSSFQGLDWELETLAAQPNVQVIILQSNSQNGPFRQWGSPDMFGGLPTGNGTITSKIDGAHLAINPSTYVQLEFVNKDVTNPVTVRRISLFHGP